MRWMILLPAFLILPAVSAQAPDKTPAELKAYFASTCVRCHGPDGSARSTEGKKLKGQDFTDEKWRAKATDEALAKTIRKGIFFGLAMPSFKEKLSEADARLMVREVVRKAEKGKVITAGEEAAR